MTLNLVTTIKSSTDRYIVCFKRGEKIDFLMKYKDIIMNLFELSFSYESPTALNIFDIKVTLSDFLFG